MTSSVCCLQMGAQSHSLYVVQVTKFLKTLIVKTLRERKPSDDMNGNNGVCVSGTSNEIKKEDKDFSIQIATLESDSIYSGQSQTNMSMVEEESGDRVVEGACTMAEVLKSRNLGLKKRHVGAPSAIILG